MSKIDPNVKLLYCLMLNKGKICNDPEVMDVRGKLPITITERIAVECIIAILENLHGHIISEDKVNLTNFSFCHFVKYGIPTQQTNFNNKVVKKIAPKKDFKGGMFRRV